MYVMTLRNTCAACHAVGCMTAHVDLVTLTKVSGLIFADTSTVGLVRQLQCAVSHQEAKHTRLHTGTLGSARLVMTAKLKAPPLPLQVQDLAANRLDLW